MRNILKFLLDIVGILFVLPISFPVMFFKKSDWSNEFFRFGSQLMSIVPGVPGNILRRAYYKLVLGLKSRNFTIEFGTIFSRSGVYIGNNVYIGPFCNIGLATIQDDVLLGSNVNLISGTKVHYYDRLDIPIRLQGGESKNIEIGKGVWIGNNAVVMESVAEQCIVGAGSVIVKPCKPFNIYVGNPARAVRDRRDGVLFELPER